MSAGAFAWSATNGLIPVAAGSSGAKGSWVEMISSTSAAAKSLIAYNTADHGSNVNANFMEIGTGAASSEVSLVDGLTSTMKGNAATTGYFKYPLGVSIASSTRVAMRCASDEDRAIRAGLSLFEGGDGYSTIEDDIGLDTGANSGTAVDPGGTANTYGSWVELKATTSNDIKALLVMLTIENPGTIGQDQHAIINLATGAASSEVIIEGCRNLPLFYDTGEDPRGGMYYIPVPTISSGARISAQCSNSDVTDAGDRVVYVNCVGLS